MKCGKSFKSVSVTYWLLECHAVWFDRQGRPASILPPTTAHACHCLIFFRYEFRNYITEWILILTTLSLLFTIWPVLASTRYNAPTIRADSRSGDGFGELQPFGLRFNQLSVSQFQSTDVQEFTTYRRVEQGCFACSFISPYSQFYSPFNTNGHVVNACSNTRLEIACSVVYRIKNTKDGSLHEVSNP